MRPNTRWSRWLALAALLIVSLWLVQFITAPMTDSSAERVLLRSLEDRRQATRKRIATARLAVDREHTLTRRLLAHRARMRAQAATPAHESSPSPRAPSRVTCDRLLRVDDRLLRNLESEVRVTRSLLDDHEELAAAADVELDAARAARSDCRRRARVRRMRNRTFVAAAVVVALAILLD